MQMTQVAVLCCMLHDGPAWYRRERSCGLVKSAECRAALQIEAACYVSVWLTIQEHSHMLDPMHRWLLPGT